MSTLSAPANEPRPARARNHVSPRGDFFYLGMALLVALVVATGFGRTIDAGLLHPPSPRPRILHLHVALSLAWVLLFIAQTALVRSRRIDWHRRLGFCGLGVGALLPVVGIAAAVVTTRTHIADGELNVAAGTSFFAVSCFDMAAFALTFWLAVAWRRKPEYHRRLMLTATCCLLSAAFARFPPGFVPHHAWYVAVDLLLLAGVAHDVIVMRRVHAFYRYGLPVLILGQALAMWLYLTRAPAWMAIAQRFFT